MGQGSRNGSDRRPTGLPTRGEMAHMGRRGWSSTQGFPCELQARDTKGHKGQMFRIQMSIMAALFLSGPLHMASSGEACKKSCFIY